jgi:hypothetical protein
VLIVKGGHAQVCTKVLHARFGLRLPLIYTEEEVLFKVDESIVQLSFHDNEGQHWLLPPGRYRAFGLNAIVMAAFSDLVFQPLDMSSVQSSLFHFVKLESPNLVQLYSDSSKGELPNVSLPTCGAETPVHDDKYNELPKTVCTPTAFSSQSSFSHPPFHPNI